MTDAERFQEAVDTVIIEKRDRQGIGRLGEKVIHASLKLFFEPDKSCHEVKTDGFVADIRRNDEIIEIQTGSFTPLRRKLEAFLPHGKVTVVYPVPDVKTLVWIDENGEFSAPRRCPKRDSRGAALGELVKILDALTDESFTFVMVWLDLCEYRLKNGWGNGGKRGSTRYERIPTALKAIRAFHEPNDYAFFLPAGLPAKFTASDFGKAAKVRGRVLSAALKVLCRVGVLTREKEGRTFFYRRVSETSEPAPC